MDLWAGDRLRLGGCLFGGEYSGQVREEPGDGQLGDTLQGTWLREQVAGAGNDLQPGLAGQPLQGSTVERQHGTVAAADHQQRGRPHPTEDVPSQVGSPATGDHRSHRGRPVGSHQQSRPGAGACPKQADGQAAGAPLGSQPVQRGGEPAGQQLDVEAQATAGALGRLLLGGQQIQQQGGQARPLKLGGNQAVAGAQPAAAAPVGEQHHALGGGRYGQVGGQPHPAGGHAHALLHRGVTST